MTEDDEVMLNTLLLDGVDLPTAMAALPSDPQPQEPGQPTGAFGWGMLLGLTIFAIWWFLVP